jgi:putative DNA primase/helicase
MRDGQAADMIREAVANAEPVEPRPPEFSDEALALEFAARHAETLRFVAFWSRWLVWDGEKWKADETLGAFDLARAVCRDAATKCNSKHRAQVASAKTVAAVERLAKADRRLAATTDQWDRNPDIINTRSTT